jgi:hypothetical protein
MSTVTACSSADEKPTALTTRADATQATNQKGHSGFSCRCLG